MENEKHLVIVTDAWQPQTNGVVTVLERLIDQLETLAIRTTVVHPGEFHVMPLPGYPEIRLVSNPWTLAARLRRLDFDFLHIPVEGPLGIATRKYCVKHRIPFSTAVHTKMPEYAQALYRLPESWGYAYLRWFHKVAQATIVQSTGHFEDLENAGLGNLVVVGGGVDLDRFKPQQHSPRQRPKLLFVGRVSKEKNIEDFLRVRYNADKIVVGDGPHKSALERRYPDVDFAGYLKGDELVAAFAQADCLVFPSKTDTFGLVLVESMACGTPVAAYPVTGPLNIVESGVNGALNLSLESAIESALKVDRAQCRSSVQNYGWQNAASRFAHVLRQCQIS